MSEEELDRLVHPETADPETAEWAAPIVPVVNCDKLSDICLIVNPESQW